MQHAPVCFLWFLQYCHMWPDKANRPITGGCRIWSGHVIHSFSAILIQFSICEKGEWILYDFPCLPGCGYIFLHMQNVTFERFTCENLFQVDIWDKTFSIQMDSDWSAADWSESDPILERMRQLTFDKNGVFRSDDHIHPTEENARGFDTISCLYDEDCGQPGGEFVFKFQNKSRKDKKNRLSSLRLQIPQFFILCFDFFSRCP